MGRTLGLIERALEALVDKAREERSWTKRHSGCDEDGELLPKSRASEERADADVAACEALLASFQADPVGVIRDVKRETGAPALDDAILRKAVAEAKLLELEVERETTSRMKEHCLEAEVENLKDKQIGLNLMASSSGFEGLGYGWPRPEDLDISEDRAYPVVAFSLTPMLASLPNPSNMRPKRATTDGRRTTTIFVRVKSARADLESWSMKYGRIQIEGAVTAPALHKGLHADVDMVEYEADIDTGAYPEEAFPGDFAFYPANRPFDRSARPFFSLSFRLTEHDLERVVPLLVASGDAVLQVIIGASQAEIESARDTVNGEIISYTLSLASEKP